MKKSFILFSLFTGMLLFSFGCASNSSNSQESAGPSNVASTSGSRSQRVASNESNSSSRDEWIYDQNVPDKVEKDSSQANASSAKDQESSQEQRSEMKRYIVRPGDSLWKIAHLHKVTVEQIRGTNKLTTDIIQSGKVLLIPGPQSKQSS